ncbi:hypothetical protein AMTRI_Chr12g270570 [Amborella trichopoda]
MEDWLWTLRTVRGSIGKSFPSIQFLGSEKDTRYVSDLARQRTLRENGMSHFLFCELSPELEDHFEIFEHIRGLYHRGVAFCKTMRGIISKRSKKRKIRDHKHRLLVAKYELRRKLYKAFCKDPNLPSDVQDKHRYKLSKLPRNSSFARVRNRCISTSHPHSLYEFFRISCIVFRGLASLGPLMSIKKSSW